MTTVVTTTSSGPYTAAAQTTFAVDFQSISVDEIRVTLNGVDVDPAQYVFNRNADGTGSVVFTTPQTGSVEIFSDPNFQNQTDFARFGQFFPDQFNAPFDRLARVDLALRAQVDNLFSDVTPGEFVVIDASGNVVGASGTGADAGLRTDLAASGGSALVNFIQSGVGAVIRTIQSWIRGMPPQAEDFGAVGDGITDDYSALQAALNTGKVIALKKGATYLISSGLDHVTGAGFVCLGGWATLKAKTGVGGFNVTSGAAPRTGLDRNMLRCNQTDNITVRNVHFTTDGATEVVLHGLRIFGGMATEGYDIRAAFSGFFNGSMIPVGSAGAGRRRNIEIVSATDSGITQGAARFAAGAQTTVLEIDNDLVGTTPSAPGVVRIGSIKNILYTGQALIDFAQQTDGVNIICQGANSTHDWDIIIGTIDGVGEPIDVQGWRNSIKVGSIRNAYNYAVKLIHGARDNSIKVGTIYRAGLGAVYVSGSDSPVTTEHTQGNSIEVGSIVETGAYGLGPAAAPGDVAAVLFANAGSTWKPKNNVVHIGTITGDGVNMDYAVKDGGADNNNDNLVLFSKASGYAVATTSAPAGNVKVRSLQRSLTELTMSTSPTVTTGVATKLPFDTVATDLEGLAVPASSGITVKIPGAYRFTVQVRLDGQGGAATNQWSLMLYQNAAAARRASGKINFGAGTDETALLTGTIYIKESDIGTANANLFAYFMHNVGVDRVVSNAPIYTRFTLERVA